MTTVMVAVAASTTSSNVIARIIFKITTAGDMQVITANVFFSQFSVEEFNGSFQKERKNCKIDKRATKQFIRTVVKWTDGG